MSDHFSSEADLLEYLRARADGTVERERLSDICVFPYRTREARQAAGAALSEFLRKSHGFPCELIPPVAAFLESEEYLPALQWLIKHRNALQSELAKGGYVGDDAREALTSLENSVNLLRSATRRPPLQPSTATTSQWRYEVFLSYSSQDESATVVLVEKLKARGFAVYFARKDMHGGDSFSDEIRDALRSSRELWLVATPNSLRSEWVITEWGAAWALAKRVVPILLRCSHTDLPSRLAALHCVDYHDFSVLLDQLETRIANI